MVWPRALGTLLSALAWVTTTVIEQTARAEQPSNTAAQEVVVVITAVQSTPIARRLLQEIEALGFTVRLENRPFTGRLESELSARGAVASVEISTASPGFIALHVLEPKTARIIRQELPIEAPNDPTATELVTTRAVELLRAARLEVTAASKPTPITPVANGSAPPKTRKAAAPPKLTVASTRRAELELGLGTGMHYVPHWSVGYHLGVSVTYIGIRRLGWQGSFSAAPSPARLQIVDVGTIAAHPSTFRLGSVWSIIDGTPVGLRLSGGLEWNQIKFNGDVAAPYEGRSVSLSTLAPWFSVASTVRISPQFQLLTQVVGSWALQRTALRYAGQELRDWGRPTLSGSIGIEWRSL